MLNRKEDVILWKLCDCSVCDVVLIFPASLFFSHSPQVLRPEPTSPLYPAMRKIGLFYTTLLVVAAAAARPIFAHARRTRPRQPPAYLTLPQARRRLEGGVAFPFQTSPPRPPAGATSPLFASPSATAATAAPEPALPAPPKRKESGEHFAYWFTTQAFLMPEIRPVTLLNMAVTALVALAFKRSMFRPLDINAHSLLAGPLGFLLSFRAQQGFDRCQEARRTWDGVLTTSRDLSRCVIGAEIMLTTEECPFPAQRLLDLTCAYGIVLEEFVSRVPRDEELQELLSERDFRVLQKRRTHRPLALTEIMAQEVSQLARERQDFRESPYFIRFLINIDKLGQHITEIHRLTKSPVPPIFYTHALRFLTLWLFTLPFALVDKFHMRSLVPTMGLMTWILFGLRELGIKAQYPFSSGLVDLTTLWKEVVFDARISLEMKDKKEEEEEEKGEPGNKEERKGKKGEGNK